MKNLAIILLAVITLSTAFGQTDKHGNPIFNSELISNEAIDGFELTSSYYTIDNNISNKNSSVFVSDNPTLTEYLKFARELPSNFFLVRQGENVLVMIVLMPKIEGSKTNHYYYIVNPNNDQSMETPCNVFGEISEKRADELLKLKVDTAATIIDLPNNGKGLLFDGIVYRIQPFEKMKAEVITIVKKLLAPDDPIEYIKKETIGGELDFNKVLEKETQGFFLFDGVAYNKKEFAIYLWGKKVKMIGISSSEDAIELWEEINDRTLTDPEKNALLKGFENESE